LNLHHVTFLEIIVSKWRADCLLVSVISKRYWTVALASATHLETFEKIFGDASRRKDEFYIYILKLEGFNLRLRFDLFDGKGRKQWGSSTFWCFLFTILLVVLIRSYTTIFIYIIADINVILISILFSQDTAY